MSEIELSAKEKILRAARALFSEHGYAGTAVGRIAKEAGVNHSLVFHHFQNKQNLWSCVKDSIVQDNNRISKVLPSSDLPYQEFLRKLFYQSIAFYREHPDIVRMLNWQRLEYQKPKTIKAVNTDEIKAWTKAFTHYQQNGDIRPEIKIEFLITLVLSVVSTAAMDPIVFIENEADFNAYIEYCIKQLSL